MRGSGARSVISHPDPALYIQEPTFATTVAVHNTANTPCRKGLQADATSECPPRPFLRNGRVSQNRECCTTAVLLSETRTIPVVFLGGPACWSLSSDVQTAR